MNATPGGMAQGGLGPSCGGIRCTMRDGGFGRRAAWRGVGGTIPAPACPLGETGKGKHLAGAIRPRRAANRGPAQACAVRKQARRISDAPDSPVRGTGGRYTPRAGASHQDYRAGARNAPHLWRAGARGEAPAPLPGGRIQGRASRGQAAGGELVPPSGDSLNWGVPRRGESRGGNLRRGAALRGGFPARGRKGRSKTRARASHQDYRAGARKAARKREPATGAAVSAARTGVSGECPRRAGARSAPTCQMR